MSKPLTFADLVLAAKILDPQVPEAAAKKYIKVAFAFVSHHLANHGEVVICDDIKLVMRNDMYVDTASVVPYE